NLGITLYHMGRHEEEIACYDRAIALRKDYDKPWNNKGATLLEMGKHEEAVLCFERGLAINPKNPKALNNKGVALKRLGRYEEALASLDSAIAVNPEYTDAHLNRGLLLQEMKRYSEAVKEYDAVLSKMKSAELYCQKASALVALERYQAALDALGAALMLRPHWDVALELKKEAEKGLKTAKPKWEAVPPKDKELLGAPFPPALEISAPVEMPAEERAPAPQEAAEKPAPVEMPAEERTPAPQEAAEIPAPVEMPAEERAPAPREAAEKPAPVEMPAEERAPAPQEAAEKPAPVEMPAEERAPAPQEAAEKPAPVEMPAEERAPAPKEATGMHCPGCGVFVMEGMNFCPHCGTDLRKPVYFCSECGAEVEESYRHCPACGASLEEEEELEVEPLEEMEAMEEAEAALEEEKIERAFDELFAEAELKRRLGMTEDALDLFLECSALSGDPKVQVHIGLCHCALQRYEDALGAFERALKMEPDDIHALHGKIEALARMERYAAASQVLDDAIDTHGEQSRLLLAKAALMRSWGRKGECMEALDRAAELFGNEDIWNMEGVALALDGKEHDALLCFDRAVQLDPQYWVGWNNRGVIALQDDELKLAAKYIDRAIDLVREAPEPWGNRAYLLGRQERYEEAVECLDEALTAAQEPWLWAEKSFLLLRDGQLEKAEEAAERGLRLDERDPGSLNMLGLVRMRMGKMADALDAFERAAAIAPDFKEAERNIALAKQGMKEGGIQCPECGSVSPKGAKSCAACGAKLTREAKEAALTREMEELVKREAKPKARKAKAVKKPSKEEFIARLMTVPGIGYAKASDLYAAGLRSEEDIARAEMADLTRIKGISPHLARKLKKGLGK
ncbi:MAG: tetratricopeptide repeat protein, partial [Candidatus Thermoplasmatota archaeon]